MTSRTSLLAFATLACAPVAAQSPLLRLQPATRPGQTLSSFLLGQPRQGFATLVDLHGGPSVVFGETFYLGLTPALTVIDSGVLDPVGLQRLIIPTPNAPSLAGTPLFAQSLVLDAAAPNGAFRASNGESAVLYNSTGAITLRFDDPSAEGWTGTFDTSVHDRLQGVPNRTRLAKVAELGAAFGQPIATPLTNFGSRAQMVYRAADLVATGEEELVTEIQWRPFGPLTFEVYPRVQITLAHSHVVPDYSVDPFSALPRFPNSGLSVVFAQNYKPNEQPVVVLDAPYVIVPGNLRPDGFLPYPPIAPFVYNGVDSLLVEFKVPPASTVNPAGCRIDIMVTSSPLPNARAYATGTAAGQVDPFTVQQGRGDNSLHHVQVQLQRVTSVATSPWLAAPAGTLARYRAPYVAAAQPPGTRVGLEFRGAQNAQGGGASPWSNDVNGASGLPFLQVRATLSGAPRTELVPSIDTLTIPVD